MSVEHLEILVEEQSMEAALELLLPKIVGSMSFKLHPHQGKADLLKMLPSRLQGYAGWLPDSYRVIVVVDRDNDDCKELKCKLEESALGACLATKSAPNDDRYVIVNRVAIEELEAWYFGDWEAVKSAYPRVSSKVPLQAKYRQPDSIKGGTWEALERVLKRAGYFKTGIRKIEVARSVASHMNPSRNTSPSFRTLRETLAGMVPA